MTTEEALKIANAPMGGHLITVSHEALRVLADALRESQAQTVQMREDAARVAEKAQRLRGRDCCEPEERIAKEIRALPAPAARTYDDGVRDAAKAIRERSVQEFGRVSSVADQYAHAAEALLSPAPAVAPVAAPKPAAFDAEKALLAAIEATRTGLDMSPTQTAREVARLLRRMLSDALAAGRGAR